MMRFYDGQDQFYCGVDLHTKRMYLCILDRDGNKRLHRNVRAKPYEFLKAIEGFRDNDVGVNRAAKTYAQYEASVRLQAIPFIGHVKLAKLDGAACASGSLA